MACLGVHFALSDEDVATLRSFTSEDERLQHLQEVIEEEYMNHETSDPMYAECDKAWDAMHRVLSDGQLTWDGGQYPLNHAVLAGELLYTGSDYIMSLKTPSQVKEIAAALSEIEFANFQMRYNAIDPANYGFPLAEDDLQYTWEWFQNVRDLYARAALANRHVLFTADQ